MMDPKTGAIVSLASQPSFNPNYYWRADETGRDGFNKGLLDKELLQRLKTQIVVRLKVGETKDFILPETVAAPDYGMRENVADLFKEMVGAGEATTNDRAGSKWTTRKRESESDSLVGFGATIAGLVNGGWKVKPYLLNAVYDHDKKHVFERYAKKTGRERLFSPTMGIRIRHDLFASSESANENMIIHVDQLRKIRVQNEQSHYILQEGLIGVIPARSPELLLLIVTQQDELGPFPNTSCQVTFTGFGQRLLGEMYAAGRGVTKSPELASQYFSRGCSLGNKQACAVNR